MGRASFALGLSVVAALTLVGPGPSTARIAPARPQQVSAEGMLQKAVEDIGRQRFVSALGEIDSLIKAQPNFRLAHLIKGDLLLSRVRPLSQIGSAAHAPSRKILDLREEAVARLRAVRQRPPEDRIPSYLIQLPPGEVELVKLWLPWIAQHLLTPQEAAASPLIVS